MPIHEGKYQCLKCEDIFEAQSGSYTKCKCGKSEIEPNYFGYRYKNDTKVKVIESDTYYFEDEFVKLPIDVQQIYDEIKQIIEKTGYKYYLHEMFYKGKNRERFLHQINLSYDASVSQYSSERNTLELTLRLEKEYYRGDGRAKFRLERFLNLMKSIESNELNVSNRKDLKVLAEKEDIDYESEPTGELNYTFYL